MLNQSFYTPGCIQCGSFLVEVSLFCSFCFERYIAPRVMPGEDCSHNLRHTYLFEWRREDDQFLSQLVYRLKAAQSPNAINFYADLLAEKLIKNLNPANYEAYIPVPGSSKKRVHSELLAKELSQQTGLKTIHLLEKTPEARQQKGLSSKERARLNPFRIKRESPEEITINQTLKGPFIFVDDVLTTGQSIKHAEMVLADGKPNAVATLFYRPPL